MATAYTGNQIGVSKKRGILTKYDEEGSDMKLLKFGDFLKGSEPFITKDINTGDPVDKDAWVRKYIDNSEIAVKRRLEDTARISKFIASPRGVLWESHMAGLETIQKNYAQKQQDKVNKIRQGGESSDPNFGQKVLRTLANLGKAALQDIGLSASTLSQVAASGTGYHADTYISRAYLKSGKGGVLNNLLSQAGLTNGEGVNGAAAVLGGAQTVAGSPDPDKLMVPDELATAKGGYGDRNIYGTKPGGRATPRNYTGSLLGSEKYGAFDLHGVTRATGSSEVQRGINSEIGSADRVGLMEELHGKYGNIWDRSEGLYPGQLSGSASSVAKNKEPEEQHYVKNTSYTLGKEGEVPYRVELNSSQSRFEEGEGDSKKVKTAYPGVDEPESYAYTDGNIDPEKKSTQDQFHPYEAEKPKPEAISVSVRGVRGKNVGKTVDNRLSTRERIFNLTYKSGFPLYSIDSDKDLTFDERKLNKELGLIPFCITTITPDHRTYLNFPAYLDSYDDNYTGDWDSVQYIGRAEKFYGYKGFTRSINLGFKVLARNESQVEPLYRNLNRLVGATAPSYGEGNVFMRGTLASLTIGGNQQGALLRDQLGFIPSVKLSWEVDVPWEIGLEGKEVWLSKSKTEKFVVPLALNVSLQFTPIEKQEVREDYGAYFVFDPEYQKLVEPSETPKEEKKEESKVVPKKSRPEIGFNETQVQLDTLGDKGGQKALNQQKQIAEEYMNRNLDQIG